MKEQIELKPCPFCGGKSQVRENYLGQTFVFCERCGSKTWFIQDDYCVRKDIVINNWNSRKQSEWIIVEDMVDAPTADVVEVVRCKDCRHCKFNSSAEVYKCDRRGYFTETVAEDGFCSYGERRNQW